jgi:PAS domain S-box-containing protein
VISIDERGRLVIFNAAAQRLFGIEHRRVRGASFAELADVAPSEVWTDLEALVSGRSAGMLGRRLELPARRADGSERVLEVCVTRTSDSPPRSTAWIRECSEPDGDSAETEVRRALLEAAEELTQVGSWDWTPREARLRWSDNLFRIFGLEPGEIDPTTEYVFAATHPDDRDHVAGEVEQLRLTGELHPVEYRIVRPDGVVRHLRATLSVADQREGRPNRMVGWVQDVTDRRRAEREIAAHIAVGAALSAWDAFESGATRLLADLAAAMDFVAGVLWLPEDDVLVARVVWHSGAVALPGFEAATRQARLPRGIDLPGRVWERRVPVNLLSLVDGPATARQRAAAADGLREAVAIPAISEKELLAVVELASREEAELTRRLLGSLTAIGYELGRFLARRRGELVAPLLTARELEILQLAAQGLSGPRTAERLVISPGTVRTHFEHIYAKLGVSDKPSAVAAALRLGLIQ